MDRLTHYATEGFKTIDGWGVDSDLIDIFRAIDTFQKNENIQGPLCEIGVHHGRTLILLGLLARDGEPIIGVDLFEDAQDQNLDSSGSGSYRHLTENISRHAPGLKFEIVKANSFILPDDIVRQMQGTRIFHIDGGHFLEVVVNDLFIAQSVLGLGGVIVIDDYWHSGFPEVQEAVHRYFWTATKIKAIPFAAGRNKIFLVSCLYKDKIMAFFKNYLPPNRQKPIKVLGYEALCVDQH